MYLRYFYVLGVGTVPGTEQGFNQRSANEGLSVYDCGLMGRAQKASLENCQSQQLGPPFFFFFS